MAETLVVVSKIKKMVKESGLRTGGDFIDALSVKIGEIVNAAVDKVKNDASEKDPWSRRPGVGLTLHPSRTRSGTLFDRIAPDYDRFNSWASFGMHQWWRREMVSRLPATGRVLDIATGTGGFRLLGASIRP